MTGLKHASKKAAQWVLWTATDIAHQELGSYFVGRQHSGVEKFQPEGEVLEYARRRTTGEPFCGTVKNVKPVINQPVLTGRDVTDYGAINFVADPFLFPGQDGHWHMFFEVLSPVKNPPGAIGHAVSEDGIEWQYDQIVLRNDHHLSFPYVFSWKEDTYMVPGVELDSKEEKISLYKAEDFPEEWRHDTTLISLKHANDDTIVFKWNGYWWLVVGETHSTDGIYVYYADELKGEYQPHDENPVVTDRPSAPRPGGRPIVYDDSVVVFYQDCEETYGHRLRCYEITELSPNRYEDKEVDYSPILTSDDGLFGWNTGRMHHIDPWQTGDRWLCAVDGDTSRSLTGKHWSISIYVG